MCDLAGCDAITSKGGKVKAHKHCKGCGVVIYGGLKSKKYCSLECRWPNGKPTIHNVECCVCSKSLVRKSHQLAIRDKFCCSLECQRQFSFVENHSAKLRKGFGKAARQAWKIARRKERKSESIEYRWWKKCGTKSGKKNKDICDFDWEKRCKSAAIMSFRIRNAGQKLGGKISDNWESCFIKSISKLKVRRWQELQKKLNLWEQKCASVAQSSQKRSKKKYQMLQEREYGLAIVEVQRELFST